MGKYFKKWDEEEYQILRSNFHKEINDIQKLLPYRTSSSIRQKCESLGITNELWKCKKAITGDKLRILKDNISMTIKDLAKLLDVTQFLVRKAIRKYQLKESRESKIWSQSDLEYLIDNYGRVDIDEICYKLDRTYNSIFQKASHLKLSSYIQKNELIAKLSKKELVELYINQNMSIGDIAQIYNVSFGNILAIAKQYNLQIRPACESSMIRGLKSRGKSSKHWTGYEEISGSYWSDISKSAQQRKIEFNITIEYIWDLFIHQNKRCFFTNIELQFHKSSLDRKAQTASLDRIDSAKGYIVGNVQWVHKEVNFMKRTLSNSELIEFCNKVSRNFYCIKE